MNANQTHCLQLLRDADPDRYLSVLYAPEDKRGALAALYAFNVEIARIRDLIHDPLPGEVRLQWWRDLINGTEHGEAVGNPVAAALLEAIKVHNLPRAAFDNYCEARIFDLYDDPMPSRNDLEGYCGETASALIQLACLVLDAQKAPAHADMAGHAGVAQAITGLLRLLPLHRRRGQVYIPADILSAVGCSAETVLDGADKDGVKRAIDAMIALAEDHLGKYEAGAKSLPAALRPAYLPVSLTRTYLKGIKASGAAAADETAVVSPLKRQWVMFRASMR
ncbi:phytoene/squalene synthase family protein [Phyllobacterium myrsinacearum]|uniref:Phytoene/squalene synthase family protein n=1 Tax=Phyllobacterium myrsinacearum TaxID=28101 RepID=A0A2S9JYG6_9HYPH|nr:phytoene/squalene synthase family protein [Phyllobacterium myrsinacearum]PRD58359.1 phytoene/squalene synthase family protein [Phyllobacterium myrsinacearum]PWV96582.1 phytoene synthase [Phyllobacterium myrsinacearum]RZV09427.1 phytoene synthase [Phyllobacterium myrsinacearum]